MKAITFVSSFLLVTRYLSIAEKSRVFFFLEGEKCRLSYLCGIGALIERKVDSVDLLLAYTIFSCVLF